MILTLLRALFLLLMGAVGWFYLGRQYAKGDWEWLTLPLCLCIGILCIGIDILAPRRKLAIFAGTFFGLVVGIIISYALSFVVQLLVDQYQAFTDHPLLGTAALVKFVDLVIGIICCYLAISFVQQTKDDFRFIIPYVEFSKQTKGPRPILLDTSALIDGRISDIAATGILESQLIVPRFVLDELQTVADSGDKLKRNRGRRGLDILAKLRAAHADVLLYEPPRDAAGPPGVDQKLISLAKDLHGKILTTDYNLNKVAQLTGVDVININDLANCLKPVVVPGERMMVMIVKSGEEPGQGIGYLADGTMVVVEQAKSYEKQEVEFTVTRALQTSAGRMIFGRLTESFSPAGGRRGRSQDEAAPTSDPVATKT